MSKARKRFFTCQKRDQAVCFRQAQRSLWICSLIFFAGNPATSADSFQPYVSVYNVQDSVKELWKGFDPEAEALDTEIVKEWVKDGVTTRYLTFNVLNFKGHHPGLQRIIASLIPQGPIRFRLGPRRWSACRASKG